MAENVDPAAIATEAWKEVFAKGPYSSFCMVDAIAKHLGMSHADILTNPERLKEFDQNSVTKDNLFKPPFVSAWSSVSGRCTSFALKVAYLLERKYPNVFKFQYYDVGKYRVARCQNTGVLIDSSSRVGAVILEEREGWTSTGGVDGCWMYADGISTYERNPRHGKKTASPIPPERAIGTCLEEVAKEATLICLFRFIGIDKTRKIWSPGFGGMLVWNIAAKRVELTLDTDRRDKIDFMSFSPEGTVKTLMKCTEKRNSFIYSARGSRQWRADGVREFHEALWKTAAYLWGYPILIPHT